MKKIILATLILFTGTLSLISCVDNLDQYLNQYSSTLYFRNSGEIPLTLYSTGDQVEYIMPIVKAGYDETVATSVNVMVNDQSTLTIFNSENNTDFKLLPADCYSIGETSFYFNSPDLAKQFKVIFKPGKIATLMNTTPADYVFVAELVDSPTKINPTNNVIVVRPIIEMPTIYFDKPGYSMTKLASEPTGKTIYKLPISLLIPNEWAFSCTVEIDQAMLDAYNLANETSFEMPPVANYSLNRTVNFTPGVNTAYVELEVDNTRLDRAQYIVPIKFTSCSNSSFKIEPSKTQILFGVDYTVEGTKLKLTETMVSGNSLNPDQGSATALAKYAIDGDLYTMLESFWNYAPGVNFTKPESEWGGFMPPHFQIDMGTNYTGCYFDFTPGTKNSFESCPTRLRISTSPDGVTWTVVKTVSQGLPVTTDAPVWKSPVITPASQFRYLRIESLSAKSVGNMYSIRELNLWVY